MDNVERILQLHEQNLQISILIENAMTCLENKIFESMLHFHCLTGGIPIRPVFTLCLQRRIIVATMGNLQYYVRIEAVMHRLKSCTSIGVEEMEDAILDELQNRVKNYFILEE